VKWPCATVFALAGIIGSLIGSTLALRVHGDVLLFAFAFAMVVIGLSMLRKPKSEGDPDMHITPRLLARIAPMGLGVGGAAGFFGIGGRFLIVPGLMMATGMTLANATASSLVSAAVFGAGSGQGILFSRVLSSRVRLARTAFAAVIVIAALYAGWKAASALGWTG